MLMPLNPVKPPVTLWRLLLAMAAIGLLGWVLFYIVLWP
jgi:hypothetical protein